MHLFIPLLALTATFFNPIRAMNMSTAPLEPRAKPTNNDHYIHPSCTDRPKEQWKDNYDKAWEILALIRFFLLREDPQSGQWVGQEWVAIPAAIQFALGRLFSVYNDEEWEEQHAIITGMYCA
jgi:hypothetical protein